MKAGIARSQITARAPKQRIKDLLYVRALVLDDGSTRLALITMDTTAIGGQRISDGILPDGSEDFLPNLRQRLQRELDIAPDHVLVNASHTHPPGRLLCSDRDQVARTFEAARQAVRNLTPVRFGAGIGRAPGLQMNRTLRLRDGRHWTIRRAHPSPPSQQVVGAGPVDPEIGVLRFDRLDGRPLAVVYNFACHPLWGDLQGRITADFPGVASRLIETTLGHGAMAMFVQGAAGDIVDRRFKDFTRPRDVEPMGRKLGECALAAWRKIRTGDEPTLRVVTETVRLPLRNDFSHRLAALERRQAALVESLSGTSLNFETFLPLYLRDRKTPHAPGSAMDRFVKGKLDKYLAAIRAMEELCRIQEDLDTIRKHQRLCRQMGGRSVPAEVVGIRLGPAALISAPIELLAEIGLRLKQMSPFHPTLVAGFSNGYLHYGPPADYYDKGGYEVTECLLAAGWQAVFERTVSAILRRLR